MNMSIKLNIRYNPSLVGAKKEETITLQASRLELPDELCQEIHGKIGHKLKEESSMYGLYQPSSKTWLESRTFVGKVRMPSGSDLLYKIKKRMIRIRFLDGTSKVINIDETKCVRELIRDICEQLKIEYSDEMSLVVAGDYAVSQHHPAAMELPQAAQSPKTLRKLTLKPRSETWGYHLHPAGSPKSLRRKTLTPSSPETLSPEAIAKPSPPMSPGQRRKAGDDSPKPKHKHQRNRSLGSWRRTVSPLKKQLSKRHQIRIDTPWLDPGKTLADQEVAENDELILMYRFYYHMELQSESANTDMLFKQARATYLAGELLCSMKDMIQFTAVLCQICKGDMDEKFCLETLVKMQHLVAPPKWKIKNYYKTIVADYAALKGMTTAEGKCCFIKLWSSLELFGFEFLSCTEASSNQKGLIGISKDKVLFLSNQKSSKAETWEFDDLIDCKQNPLEDTASLYFKGDLILRLYLPEYSGVLVDCIDGHRDLQSIISESFWNTQAFHFDQPAHKVGASNYNFATQFARDRERCALSRFTYDDIFRPNKTINPLFSNEEVEDMQSPWENPLFENTDQLMDERFSFLNLKEYSDKINDDDVIDGPPQAAINGAGDSDSDSDHGSVSSDDELCETQPLRADVKLARRVSKDQS